MKKTGIELIAEERREQIEKHGRTVEYDVLANKKSELSWMAVVLTGTVSGATDPEGWDEEVCQKMRNKGRIERLTIAGALIAAEIDRLQAG